MFFIFFTNTLGEKFHWDYTLWYFDIVMHSLGGAWVGLFFIYFFSRIGQAHPARKFFLKVFLASLLAGILWEFYEFYIYQIVSLIRFDVVDVATDVVCDALGAGLAFLYYGKRIMAGEENRVQSV